MRHSAGPIFAIEYLGEFETELENILGVYQWPRGDQLAKPTGRKSLAAVS
jgi:hypothetical protein